MAHAARKAGQRLGWAASRDDAAAAAAAAGERRARPGEEFCRRQAATGLAASGGKLGSSPLEEEQDLVDDKTAARNGGDDVDVRCHWLSGRGAGGLELLLAGSAMRRVRSGRTDADWGEARAASRRLVGSSRCWCGWRLRRLTLSLLSEQ